MKLTVKQLRAAAQGAVLVEQRKDGIHFERFTEQERAVYIDNEGHIRKSHATAGVRLEFTTDSTTLYLHANVSLGSSRTWFCFEVFANGEKVGELGNGDTERFGKFKGEFALGDGMKKVCVYFPWSAVAVIKEVSLSKGACFVPIHRPRKMLMFGDSITQGYDARYSSRSYASRLSDALGMDTYNKGIGGEVFHPALAAADHGVVPDMITVAYGTNDWSHGIKETFERDCLGFYRAISEKYPNAQIFAITPIFRVDHDAPKEWHFAEVSAYIKQVAASLPNVTAIDGFDLVPHDTAYFADAKLHPNDEGFAFYFENLLRAILEHLS